MFEKSLGDLVRGIRSHRGNEPQFISQCMAEIKRELKGGSINVKANAISKLTYLQMLGYDITWAAFNIIEVMSSSRFTYKRIGYLAASQCFYDDLDLVMLTTNMIKKDLSSPNQYEAGLALCGLSCFVTPDIARDLANDVLTLTASSKPYIKKKAVVVMFKIFLKFPDALRPAFPRLKTCLEDPDPGVQCAAVSVICELAQKNPKNYLSLAPILFKLMNSSSNNWMLIKIIKLFGALCPLEPRLGKKLAEPLTGLIHSTSAMSLLYECVCTVVAGMPTNSTMMQLCVSKLRLFMEDADQNLKYLGLLAMSAIIQQQPKAVMQVKDIIMDCMEDKDESIRVRALELIVGMATKKNITELVRSLLGHIDATESTFFRDIVIEKIIFMCSNKGYAHITNFEWYITILVEMTRFEGTRHGKLIASQMLDVTIRVKDVRPFSVRQMATIVENTQLFVKGNKNGPCEVLYAASWIVGEFCEYLSDPLPVIQALIHPRITDLPGHIQAVFVQNIIKLYARILVKAEAEGDSEMIEEVGAMLVEKLPVFMQSSDLEVQERACGILQLMKYIVKLQSKGAAVADELQKLFVGDLNPVAPKAQRKVPVPEGLDLDKWINDPPSESEEEAEFEDEVTPNFFGLSSVDTHRSSFNDTTPESTRKNKKGKKGKKGKRKHYEGEGEGEEGYDYGQDDEEELQRARELRLQNIENNPHYLKPSSVVVKKAPVDSLIEEGEEISTAAATSKDIPVTKLELGIPLVIDAPSVRDALKSKKGKKGKKGKGGKRRKGGQESDEDTPAARPVVDTTAGELPEGALESDDKDSLDEEVDEVTKKLNVNLDVPLRDDEALPVRTHRIVMEQPVEEEKEERKKKRGDKKSSKKGKKKKSAPAVEGEEGEEEEEPKRKKKSSKKTKEAALLDLSGEVVDVEEPSESHPPPQPVKQKKKKTTTTAAATAAEPDKDNLDDLDFWLSTNDANAKEEKVSEEATPIEHTPTGATKSKKKATKEGKKSSKSGGKKSRKSEEAPSTGSTVGGELLELELGDTSTAVLPADNLTSFKLLAEDENLKLTYDIKASPMYNTRVTVAVVFSNNSSSQLTSLDFNILDSLNAKLDRPSGVSPQSSIAVPFQLPPGSANECQFTFSVQEFYMVQKLRGTVTYMIKSDSGTAQDKIDFKLTLLPSGFICPTTLPQDRFAALLSGGNLCDTVTAKCTLSKTPDFMTALRIIVKTLHLSTVELVQEGASLYGQSIAGHHICVLVKAVGDTQIGVSVKGSDARLVSSLVDEIKTIV